MTERLAGYANAHGRPTGWPYYSLDGERPVTAAEWDALRYTWRHAHGVTNVWSRRPLHGEERLKGTLRRAAPRVHNPTAASSGAADRGVTLPVRGLSPPSASLSRRLTGLFTVVLVWVLISAYGSQIAMGVGEEKQNRIVEVILASVRPVQLLVGKVTGIGVLALALAALMVVAFLGLGAAVGSSLVHGAAPGIVICGAVFLVLGYAFYCTAYAAAGSLVSRQSDVGTVILRCRSR